MRSFYSKPLLLRRAKRGAEQIGTLTAVCTAVAKHAPELFCGKKQLFQWFSVAILAAWGGLWGGGTARLWAAGGSLTLKLEDESSGQPVIARVEFFRGAAATAERERQMPVRKTVTAGLGVVVDRQVVLELPDGPYRFRVIRGPEYRVVSGNFTLEKTSLDEKTVALPRMVDMTAEGWLAGDCCVVPSPASLPLRMASEDLHVAAVMGARHATPIPGRESDEPIDHDPSWIRTDAVHHQGLLFYGLTPEQSQRVTSIEHSTAALVAATAAESSGEVRVAIENPFAWNFPSGWRAKRSTVCL